MQNRDASDNTAIEFDQLYIDMMLPHHASVVALAQAAWPDMRDDRLIRIAENIVSAQGAQQEEMAGYRARFYGSEEPTPMDDQTMHQMMEAMPNMSGPMGQMAFLMDSDAMVAEFRAADNADAAFIDLVIPHHQMAVEAAETAVTQAVHDEIKRFAERAVSEERSEIERLYEIRADMGEDVEPEVRPGFS